jgi:hypothetical protein
MTSKREEIARAIEGVFMDLGWACEEGDAAKVADAALSALMTPSEGMIEAGIAFFDTQWANSIDCPPTASEMRQVFTAMIRAAEGRGE